MAHSEHRHWLRSIIRPSRALGWLEDMWVNFADLQSTNLPGVANPRLLVFLADHGVAEAGVSGMPVNGSQALIHRVGSRALTVSVMSEYYRIPIQVIDVGSRYAGILPPGIEDCRVCRGTRNPLIEPAMTLQEYSAAVRVGAKLVDDAAAQGVDLIGVGEIGIGNTAVASMLLAGLLNIADPAPLVGRGTGIDDAAFERKRDVVLQTVSRYRNSVSMEHYLAAVGGPEFAAISGAIEAATRNRIPVVLDGFATAVAALCAARSMNLPLDFLIPSHLTREPGHAPALEALGLKPVFYLELAIGEGVGALLVMDSIRMTCDVVQQVAARTTSTMAPDP